MSTSTMPGHTSRQWRRCGIKVAVLGCKNTSCSTNFHDCIYKKKTGSTIYSMSKPL